MRRGALVGVALLAAGLGGGLALGLSTRPAARTTTLVRTRPIQVVNELRSAGRVPAPLPTIVNGATAHDVDVWTAVPADANVDGVAYVDERPQQLIVTWERARLTRDHAAIWQRRGVAIWQHDRGPAADWHRVYTFEAPVSNETGVVGFRVSLGDVSGDGRPEVLVFFDTDGSSGSGTYHLFANSGYRLRQALVKRLSEDEGTISFAHGALVVLAGLDYDGTSVHCCFRKVRETWLRWNGRRLVTVRQLVRPNRRRWPPG